MADFVTSLHAAFGQKLTKFRRSVDKVGIPNFVSGPREYIMEGEYVILAMCSWFRIRQIENTVYFTSLKLYALVVMPWVCR